MRRTLLLLAATVAIFYGGDWSVFHLRGTPTQSIKVRRYLAIHEKANRVEYVFNGEQDETCARAIFPRSGYPPCWYLARHAEQRIDL